MKIDFWHFKVQLSKLSQIESFQILGFFETNRSVGAKPLKSGANIIADSETFKRYRDFDTWVGRWSNWNGDVMIFSHFFLTNVVIRLLHPKHLDGIWIGQDQYRMPLAPLSEYPEP